MVYIARQRVVKAVRTVQSNVSGLGLLFALVIAVGAYMVGRAWVVWCGDVYTRHDPVAAAMLIFTMGLVLGLIGLAAWLRATSKNR